MVRALALFALGAAIVAACSDAAVAERCSDIPAGGCPLARGVACEDPTCDAVYYCRPNNVWELAETCPPRAARDASAVEPADAATEASPIVDASIDAPPGAYGGPGCGVLQIPDCSLGLALSCGADCCGCFDLFVCRDGAWDLWGFCGDAGPRQ